MENTHPGMINRTSDGGRKVDTQVNIVELYRRYYRKIFNYLFYRVGDRAAAEDLAADLFERVLRTPKGVNQAGPRLQAWLFQIARNLSIDYHRRQRSHRQVELEDNLVVDSQRSEGAYERVMTSETLRLALDRLSDDQRDVIVMRFVADMPIAQVAKTLNKSEDAIKGLQRRSLLALRQILADWEVTYERPSERRQS